MTPIQKLRLVRNAGGQPRPIDLGALLTLDSATLLNSVDGLLATLEDRAKGLTDEDALTLDELVKMAADELEAARAALEDQTTAGREKAAGHTHAALIALGDGALMLVATGKLTPDAKNVLDPAAIYAKRRVVQR